MAARAVSKTKGSTPTASSLPLDATILPKTNVMSAATAVRQHVAAVVANNDAVPLRTEDPETGALTIFASTDALLAWLPLMEYDRVTAWAKMPVFRVLLFPDRQHYESKATPYVDHVFPQGEDLAAAVVWWRKRVSQEGRGFAVFEGGFDTTGVVLKTDPPSVCVDATTGEVQADGHEEIESKRLLHEKRKNMDLKWTSKGVSDEMRAKIEAAEMLIREKKRQGKEYMLKGGWVVKGQAGDVRLAKHNEIQKKFGCR